MFTFYLTFNPILIDENDILISNSVTILNLIKFEICQTKKIYFKKCIAQQEFFILINYCFYM